MTQLEIEFRAATQLGVSFPKRQIELVVMPYETEAEVVHHGRLVREIVSRGAFEGIDAKRRRILVNRGHVIDNIVGRAARFHPSRREGLVAEIEIAKTSAGDDTLELANDGYLDASAGFGVPDGGEQWPERGLRRLTRLWLDHIAMTPTPRQIRGMVNAPPDRVGVGASGSSSSSVAVDALTTGSGGSW